MNHTVLAPLCISIVSHGHGPMLRELLEDLKNGLGLPFELIVTLNIPEQESFLQALETVDFPWQVLRNSKPQGFGANHNQAFQHCKSPFFLVLNPDARLIKQNLQACTELFHQQPNLGLYGAKIVDSSGAVQATARAYPTLRASLYRFLVGSKRQTISAPAPIKPDWIAGMFMLFRSDAYRAVKGFDERYFMYLEDVDICKRLQLKGCDILYDDTVTVVHDGQYASRRNLKHLSWHVRSLLRFLITH
jgi:N-acetylglucosaminyl-diphospho-decaprenol L-rhamnosyltransferase